MAALDAAQAGSLGTLEVSRPSSETGDTARRPLDQEWQRARAAVSSLARACLLHAPDASSHATLHPVASGMPWPALPPGLLSNACHINSLSLWHGPCFLS